MPNRQPYADFEGVIGRTFASSQPSWPPRKCAPAGSPNVILMIADDMGYSDIGPFGSEIDTPHLDALAAAGVRYANFHVTPFCSPTRAELLTGCDAHSVGMGFLANIDPGFPGYTGELSPHQPTMAEALRDFGYATMAIGKWHLCRDSDCHEAADRRSWPLHKGFERYYGFLEAMTSLHQPHRLYRDHSMVEVDRYPDDYYLTDDLTDQALQMIRSSKAADPGKPFFLYFAHAAVHAPQHAKRVDMAKYTGRYAAGWDGIRQARFERQQLMGVVAKTTGLAPRNSEPMADVKAWADLSGVEKALACRYMEVYAAMVDNLDQNLGRLLDGLRAIDELDNTLVLFMSDNGGSRMGMDRGTTMYLGNLGGKNSPQAAADAVLEADHARLDEIGGPTTWPHYPRGWAMVSNTPFRLYKMTAHAGAHQVPLIVSWPRGIAARGELRHQFVHVTDVLPTLAELIGFSVPDAKGGQPAVARIGTSFQPSLSDPDAPSTHRESLIEVAGHRSFYRDGWEIVTYHLVRSRYTDNEWQLYHMAEDPTQLHDLAQQYPEKVRELAQAWEKYARQYQVYPLCDGLGIKRILRPADVERLARPVTLRPGTPTLERFRSAQLIHDRDYRILAQFAAPGLQARDEGVLVAHGGQEGGYVVYVEAHRLVYAQNVDGKMRWLQAEAPEGASSVEIDVRALAGGTWSVSLRADGVEIGRRDDFVRFIGFLPYEGIDVGIDRRSPVSWDLYRRHGCFAYSGRIDGVRYEPGAFCADAPQLHLEELRQQALRYE